MPVEGIKRSGRATQGVIVMRLREGEQVATLALVVGSEDGATEDDSAVGSEAEVVELPDSAEEPQDD
jgi:DNA gyrase subunit A